MQNAFVLFTGLGLNKRKSSESLILASFCFCGSHFARILEMVG